MTLMHAKAMGILQSKLQVVPKIPEERSIIKAMEGKRLQRSVAAVVEIKKLAEAWVVSVRVDVL